MSVERGDGCVAVPCQTALSFEDLLKSCIYKENQTGCIYLRVKVMTTAALVAMEPLIGCQSDMELEKMLQACFSIGNDGVLQFNVWAEEEGS